MRDEIRPGHFVSPLSLKQGCTTIQLVYLNFKAALIPPLACVTTISLINLIHQFASSFHL